MHGRPVSFATFALVVDFIARIPVVIILRAGTYLTVIWNADPKVFGAVVMRGDHCDLEHPAERNNRRHLPDAQAGRAGVVTVLGIAHPKNWNPLIYPMADHANGGVIPGSLHGGARADRRGHVLVQRVRQRGQLRRGTTGSSKRIAHGILLALVITTAAKLIPATATIAGSPSRPKLAASLVPMQDFIEVNLETTPSHDRQPGRGHHHPQCLCRDRADVRADHLQLWP